MASNIRRDSPLFDVYLEHLLESIISRGDIQSNHSRNVDVELAAQEIAQFLQPLAILMSTKNLAEDHSLSEEVLSLLRDMWFNLVVHGFTISTPRGQRYLNELRLMAIHSQPLVAEYRGEQVESDIELNTVLRRGMNSDHESLQKKRLSALLPTQSSEIRSLSYRKVIFLQAAYLVEMLRAESGDCTKALTYFLEPSMRSGDMSSTMEAITKIVMETYLKTALSGLNDGFSASFVAKQLVSIFCGCCHRIERVQQAAVICANMILRNVPSALCQKSSLFALLELLSLMWTSCLEAETDEYDCKSTFTSTRGNVTIVLSDDYNQRKKTLNALYKNAKTWVRDVIDIAPLDVKGLLQTYLSEYDDDGAYGHVSLGRSFASEMGGLIPRTDQRLQALDIHGEYNINTASDFLAQYTTRQEYRLAEALPDQSAEWLNFVQLERRGSSASRMTKAERDYEDILTVLAHLEVRTHNKKFVPIGEVKDVLRRAAALLCRSKKDECAIVHHLVTIPFFIFTKQSIKLGISLWLGVINENPRMEPRLLTEIAQQWEVTIQRKVGIFNDKFLHPDPFYIKQEFAPSDKSALARRQHAAHNMLTPHARLLQFLGSHFNATRLSNDHTQHIFVRLLRATLKGLKRSTPHPLAREIRFQIIHFGLRVLQHCTGLSSSVQWRLKEEILDAALSWFSFAPCWSFGGNRLQVKAEVQLLQDVEGALKPVVKIMPQYPEAARAMRDKEELLKILLENEQYRLTVWLYPLGEPKESNLGSKRHTEALLAGLVRTAWHVNPSLAVQLATRFPSYPKLLKEVRWLLLNFTDKALSEPEALPILLGGELPSDVTFQLQVYILILCSQNNTDMF